MTRNKTKLVALLHAKLLTIIFTLCVFNACVVNRSHEKRYASEFKFRNNLLLVSKKQNNKWLYYIANSDQDRFQSIAERVSGMSDLQLIHALEALGIQNAKSAPILWRCLPGTPFDCPPDAILRRMVKKIEKLGLNVQVLTSIQ